MRLILIATALLLSVSAAQAGVTTYPPLVSTTGAGLAPTSPNDATKYLDGTGAYSKPAGAVGANPSATCGPAAQNGVATTFMRSDATPACQSATNAQQGLVQCDGTTITCSAGVASAATQTGVAFKPGFRTGVMYGSDIYLFGTNQTGAITANTLYATPFYSPQSVTWTHIGSFVNAAVAGKHLEFGIYSNTSSGQPGSLLLDSGSIGDDSCTPGCYANATISYAMAPGWYWLVVAGDAAPTLTGLADSSFHGNAWYGSSVAQGVGPSNNIQVTGAWTFSAGNLPASFPTITYAAAVAFATFLER